MLVNTDVKTMLYIMSFSSPKSFLWSKHTKSDELH